MAEVYKTGNEENKSSGGHFDTLECKIWMLCTCVRIYLNLNSQNVYSKNVSEKEKLVFIQCKDEPN